MPHEIKVLEINANLEENDFQIDFRSRSETLYTIIFLHASFLKCFGPAQEALGGAKTYRPGMYQ